MLRTELHCHNVFSNGHVGDLEPPFDCNASINEQLEKSLDSKLDVLFVTNHNTLDGFPSKFSCMHHYQVSCQYPLMHLLLHPLYPS